jgi:glycosyltransferase involved in cell wall biosynthesis
VSHKNNRKWQVLVYLDSIVFGGHEVTLVDAVRGLALEPRISLTLLVPHNNKRLLMRLQPLTCNVRIERHSFRTAPGDVFRVLFNTGKVRQLKKKMLQYQPNLVIVSQGAIALSACGLGAAHSADIPLMSFLPMAHPATLVRGKESPSVRMQDWLYRHLYGLPDYYITLCESTRKQLHELHKVVQSRVFVHYFGMDINSQPRPKLPRQHTADKKKHIALIGRIEFHQKRHNFLIRQLAAFRNELPPLHVHIIGDGPDLHELQLLVKQLQVAEMVSFEGWAENMDYWYKILDAILLPSRFEGFPVVMLESMYWGIPVIASKLDSMADILPQEWLFSLHDGAEMVRCIQYVFANDQHNHLLRNQQIIYDRMNVNVYQKGICKSVLNCLQNNRQIRTSSANQKHR